LATNWVLDAGTTYQYSIVGGANLGYFIKPTTYPTYTWTTAWHDGDLTEQRMQQSCIASSLYGDSAVSNSFVTVDCIATFKAPITLTRMGAMIFSQASGGGAGGYTHVGYYDGTWHWLYDTNWFIYDSLSPPTASKLDYTSLSYPNVTKVRAEINAGAGGGGGGAWLLELWGYGEEGGPGGNAMLFGADF